MGPKNLQTDYCLQKVSFDITLEYTRNWFVAFFWVYDFAIDTGGLSEMIEDGKIGFIAPVSDVKMSVEKTAAILRDEALAESMGKRARELAETASSWDEIGLRIAGTFRKI